VENFLDDEANVISGDYVYTAIVSVKGINRKTLQEDNKEVALHRKAHFVYNFKKGCLTCDKKSDVRLVTEFFELQEGVELGANEQYEVKLVPLLEDLEATFGYKGKCLKIQDYLAREGMVATANFKTLKVDYWPKAVSKYGENMLEFQVEVNDDGQPVKTKITKKGDVVLGDSYSDKLWNHIRDYVVASIVEEEDLFRV